MILVGVDHFSSYRMEKLFDWADVEGLDLEKSKVSNSRLDMMLDSLIAVAAEISVEHWLT